MKSLEIGIGVLKTFIGAASDLSVTEVVAATGLKKSHVSKILSAYREAGFLVQDPMTRRYSVGIEAFELGAHYAARQPMAREALPLMRQLVDQCGHSATLSILHHDHVLHLMAVEGPLYIDGRWRVGSRLPIHATASGKVLVAWLDAEHRDSLLDAVKLDAITPLTITDPIPLKAQLSKVHASGLAVTRGESAPGLAAMAVPIFDGGDHVAAALGLVIPDQIFANVDVLELKDRLFDVARSLSLKLGASTYPFGGERRPVSDTRAAARMTQ